MTVKTYCPQTGKVAYKTRREAYESSRTMAKYMRQKPRKVYCCKFCGKYHLTHSNKRASVRK